jgi:hypothetical protein
MPMLMLNAICQLMDIALQFEHGAAQPIERER